MYFWKISKLEEDLKKGLTEKEDVKYLLAISTLYAIGMVPMVLNPNIYDYVLWFLMIVFVIIEIILLYRINEWENWKNFLSRYLSIGWVVLLRSFIFVMIPLLVAYIFINIYFLWNPDLESANISDVALSIFYPIWYLYMQIQSFKRINA
jgi:hypothetical protein